ncbi:glycine oxidase ThiO [filamentous cyanobacterium LEGE 11480]|uniref:glycine oxidase n=1 Tax=Romeriopsis navalis LEGE 11480 TaxID=2777977 RepID=A0A928VQE4_9CYAN|nr:glycine oxidase ThiO [Romeriopsis navalis]MBE9032595.1 glycine oxidase ThiO [Romeriopsis navalis LEGE 11480]
MEKREIVIMGGGLMALTIGLALQQRGASVTILGADFAAAAGHAAAGMLAPQAEGLPPSPMLDLCLRSRSMYADWAAKLESLTGQSVGYWPCGIMAPAYAAADFPEHPIANWCSLEHLGQTQLGLSDAVQGGWWFPKDAQVDNRKLMPALLAAVQAAGGEICSGVRIQSIDIQATASGSQVTQLSTNAGEWQADHYILAAGAWSQSLLPIPVTPRKGQMLSLRWVQPDAAPLPLQCVLFGSDIYIVPRQDGRVVVGATSESVGFTNGNTAAGVQRLLTEAIRLFPALQDCHLLETWWGYRPETPDELPILGESMHQNLTVATGHYRNGILLAPITGQIIADWVMSQRPDDLLSAFHWSRFNGL